MMAEEKNVLTKISDAMGTAMDKAQDMGVSLVRKTENAAAEAKREAAKVRTAVKKNSSRARFPRRRRTRRLLARMSARFATASGSDAFSPLVFTRLM